jgi:putative cell wall-binding protein
MLVCTGSNFADSLSGSATGMPILMVNNALGRLTENQKAFLAGFEGSYCVIGGEGAVSANLESQLAAYGAVRRLAGSDRFETSVLVAQIFFEAPTSVVLAYAGNFPDGLCGGVLANAIGAPLILTMTHRDTLAASYARGMEINRGVVLGGDSLIADSTVRWIFSLTSSHSIVVK